MTFEYVLNTHGLQDKTDLTLNYDVAFNLMVSAFEAGTGDYCTMFDPTAYEYEAAGKGYVVASVGEASGEVPYTCFMAKNSWIEKNESVVEGFLRAITKAVKYINETDSKTVAPYLTKYFEFKYPCRRAGVYSCPQPPWKQYLIGGSKPPPYGHFQPGPIKRATQPDGSDRPDGRH